MEKKSFWSRQTLAGFKESKRLPPLVSSSWVNRGRVITRQRGVDKYKLHVLIAIETLLKSSQWMTLLVVDDDGNDKLYWFKEREEVEKKKWRGEEVKALWIKYNNCWQLISQRFIEKEEEEEEEVTYNLWTDRNRNLIAYILRFNYHRNSWSVGRLGIKSIVPVAN